MLSPEDVKVLDINSAYHGVPTSRLMANAGEGVARLALRRFAPRSVLVLAGPGNNGGDGAVAAAALAREGVRTTLLYARDPELLPPGDARSAYRRVDPRAVRIETFRSVANLRRRLVDADLVVDALLGVGRHGELREPIRTIVRAVNAARRPVLAVDVPTGLGGRLAVRPRVTATLHAVKEGLTPANGGTIVRVPIGIPEAALRIGPGDLAVHYPRNRLRTRKGQNGKVALFAGGAYPGAANLAALACLRAGADLVRLYTGREGALSARILSPDLIVHSGVAEDRLTPADVAAFQRVAEGCDVVVLGPGLGDAPETMSAVREVLEWTQRRRMSVVLDAEAQAVAGRSPELLEGRLVLATPHPVEFERLTGRAWREGREAATARAAARRLGITVVAKTFESVVTDGRRVRVSPRRPAWMSVGGCGDVLAGVSAAMVAKGLDPFRAGCVALALTSLAAEEAFATRSWSARASDLIESFGAALRAWVPNEPGPETER